MLAPTLWRTCRAMMNPLRLQLLRMVFEHDDSYTVSDFARVLGVEQSTATIYLRQLNARGLIGVRRQRIKVFYNTTPDRSLPEALVIREIMRPLEYSDRATRVVLRKIDRAENDPKQKWRDNSKIKVKHRKMKRRIAKPILKSMVIDCLS